LIPQVAVSATRKVLVIALPPSEKSIVGRICTLFFAGIVKNISFRGYASEARVGGEFKGDVKGDVLTIR